VYHVTSPADSGPGSFRDGAELSSPTWIVFDDSFDIALHSPVALGPKKTIDGRGKTITLRDYGITIGSMSSNVVIENMNFIGNMQGSNNDAIQIADGAHTIWIDHCSLSNYGDGLIDVTHAATDVTISWSLFSMHDLVMLIGRSPDDSADVDIRVTLHHNWWNQTGSYAPRLRFGKVHLFNNLIDRWRTSASSCTMNGELASEANIFVADIAKVALAISAWTDPVEGRIRSMGDSLRNGATVHENAPDSVFQPAAAYVYVAVPADSTLQAAIMAGAGAH
jgi:pectate lyase